MAVEIERKFLVADESWRSAVQESFVIVQGYLNMEQRCSIRVRTSGARAWLNIKGATVGHSRLEFEYPIPAEDAQTLLRNLCCGPLVEKTRHLVPMGPHVWEIDVFSGENTGLVVAEIELSSADEPFTRPIWLGEEVTFDARYYNTLLSRHPYRSWQGAGA